jgi:hypothetical protein
MLPKLRISLVTLLCLLLSNTDLIAEVSGTLPVLYVNTINANASITKEDYQDATYWLDNKGVDGVDNIGSQSAPLSLQIKGRGNYTWWGFDKKPYKLKLADKQPLMGLNKSKQFVLLAHADDSYGFLRNAIGFELSRRMGMPWTPEDRAIELVLNGEYQGLYFLTENIKVDKNRVNIVEQADLATDPEAITGGWLVEIDNYDSDPHVSITEGNGERIVFTYKSPEMLSAEQEAYLTQQVKAMNNAIYAEDKSSTEWENYIDMDILARYYIVQEITDDTESFHGSCYLYRDKGEDSKWMFGPVWDFGNTYARDDKKFIYMGGIFNQTWIGEIAKFPRFQERVKELYAEFIENEYPTLSDYVEAYVENIAEASVKDYERWPSYGCSDIQSRKNSFLRHMRNSVNWLSTVWLDGNTDDVYDEHVYLRGQFNNWDVSDKMEYLGDNTYRLSNITFSGEFKIATEDWSTVNYGSNGAPAYLNQPYIMVRNTNDNVHSGEDFNNVTVTFNSASGELLISDEAGVAMAVDDSFAVDGNVVTYPGHITVYDIAGRVVVAGDTRVAIPSSGIYLVKYGDSVAKVIVK